MTTTTTAPAKTLYQTGTQVITGVVGNAFWVLDKDEDRMIKKMWVTDDRGFLVSGRMNDTMRLDLDIKPGDRIAMQVTLKPYTERIATYTTIGWVNWDTATRTRESVGREMLDAVDRAKAMIEHWDRNADSDGLTQAIELLRHAETLEQEMLSL